MLKLAASVASLAMLAWGLGSSSRLLWGSGPWILAVLFPVVALILLLVPELSCCCGSCCGAPSWVWLGGSGSRLPWRCCQVVALGSAGPAMVGWVTGEEGAGLAAQLMVSAESLCRRMPSCFAMVVILC